MNKDRLAQVSKNDFDSVLAKFPKGPTIQISESFRTYTNDAKNRVVGERHKFENIVEYYLTDEMCCYLK